MSKLPRLSDSPKPPPPDPTVPPSVQPVPVAEPPRMFAEAWISIGVGIVLLLLMPRLLQYLFSHNFTWTFSDAKGNPLPYTHSDYFLNDLAVTSFAVALILEGIVLAISRRRWVVILALLVTAAATAGNLLYLIYSYSTYGVAIISALAVIFGVYMVISEWRLLRS